MSTPPSTNATANALTPSASVPATTETPKLGAEWRRLREKWMFLTRRPTARGKVNELITLSQLLLSRRGDVSGAHSRHDNARRSTATPRYDDDTLGGYFEPERRRRRRGRTIP